MSESPDLKKVYCPACTDEVIPKEHTYESKSKIEGARAIINKVCPSCMYVFGSKQAPRNVQTY